MQELSALPHYQYATSVLFRPCHSPFGIIVQMLLVIEVIVYSDAPIPVSVSALNLAVSVSISISTIQKPSYTDTYDIIEPFF